MSTIALCVVTRNAAATILKCLSSAASLVDYVLVADLGSNDGTQAAVHDWLRQTSIQGQVYEAPDRDSEDNHTHILAHLRENHEVDFALLIEANDQLVLEDGFNVAEFKQGLAEDVYSVWIRDGFDHYQSNLICSNRLAFSYRETPFPSLVPPAGRVTWRDTLGLHVLKGTMPPADAEGALYQRDAQLIGRILQADFTGRIHERADEVTAAADYFVQRAELGHWADELFLVLYRAAQLEEAMGAQSVDELITGYVRASVVVPTRAEALHAAARICRLNGRYAEGYEFAKRGLKIPVPKHGLFIEQWIYDYALLDEFAVCASWVGQQQESLDACNRLLREGKLPASKRQRVTANAELAANLLASQGAEPASSLQEPELPPATIAAPEGNRPKLVLVCGPWGSGTSAVTGLLMNLGAIGIGPYFQTYDPRTPISYESIPFKEVIDQHVSGPTLTPLPDAQGAVHSGLLELRRRIEAQEFGPYNVDQPNYVVLKNQAAVLFLPQLCDVFDTKLIYVMRPLKEIEQTRLRRFWPPLTGALGAALIYRHMADALPRYSSRTMILAYNGLLESPVSYIQDIVRFLNFDPGQQNIDQAVEFIASRGARAAP